jgi:serine/threonine protein kinase
LHQDLSTNNVLLAADGEAKLADFGLARVRAGTASFQTQHLRGTPHYMSPEVWEGRHITEAVDVYALAMVMYETWTGEVPWSGFRVNEIGKRVTRGERPKAPAASFGALVQAAWAQNPSERPTASSLSASLHRRDEALQELASCGATAFSEVSSTTLFTLLKTLGHASDSSRPSQLHQAARTALRAEGLSTFE